MNKIFDEIILWGWILTLFSFLIAYYMNVWIYYSNEKDKFPLFPILNPFSFSTFELLFKSMFKINWKIEGENKKMKFWTNIVWTFSGIMLLLTITGELLD